MMHLDPRPMNHDELSFQDEALMAYLREVASEREFGPKKQRDLDFEERRASDIWHSARFDFIPDPDKEYEVVCKRMDWYRPLPARRRGACPPLAGGQLGSGLGEGAVPGCQHGMEYEPMYGDHSPFRKEEFNRYRHVHFGMIFRERMFSFRSRQFMEAVHEYYRQDDWMWNNNQRGQSIETYIWNEYFDPDRDLYWPFQLEQGDEFFEILGPRWYAMGGKPLTWCTYSDRNVLRGKQHRPLRVPGVRGGGWICRPAVLMDKLARWVGDNPRRRLEDELMDRINRHCRVRSEYWPWSRA